MVLARITDEFIERRTSRAERSNSARWSASCYATDESAYFAPSTSSCFNPKQRSISVA